MTSCQLRVVNRLGEANTWITITPPVTITIEDGQTRLIDAEGRDYAWFQDGSYRGQTIDTTAPGRLTR